MAYMRNGMTTLTATPNPLGDYQENGNWSWMFYPPPYDFLAPPQTMPAPGQVLPEDILQPGLRGFRGFGRFGGRGMGCAGGCSCGGTCGGLGDDSTDATAFAPIAAPAAPGIMTDFSTLGSDLASSVASGGSTVLAPLSTDTILGVPAWVWLAGGVVAWMFLFSGGKNSRVSRGKRSAKKAASRAGSAVGTFGFRSYGRAT